MYVVHQRQNQPCWLFSFSFPTHHLDNTVHPLHHIYTGTRTTSKRNICYRYHQPAMPPKTKQSKKGTAKPKRVPHANETPLKHKAPGHGAVERAKDQMWDEPSTSSGGGGGSSSLLPQTTTTAPKLKYKATTTSSISSMMMGIGRGGGIGSGGKKKNPTTASRKTTGTTTTRSAAATIIPTSSAADNNNNNNTERKINPDSDFFSSSKSASKR